MLIKERGHRLVAVTSLEHTARSEPRHPSGKRLAEIADVVLDNGAPYGDVVLANSSGAVSSVTAAVLAQMVVTEVVGAWSRRGRPRPSTCRPTSRAVTSTTAAGSAIRRAHPAYRLTHQPISA